MVLIYHVTIKEEWHAAKKKGFYVAPSLEIEGLFIAARNIRWTVF
jgi:uncharacterized protein (DUF952 family)